jgi:glucosylceramidase
VSHFVKNGAQRIGTISYTGFENQVAFRNPDGSLVIVIHNDMATPQPVEMLVNGNVLSVVLPADSFSTFVVHG